MIICFVILLTACNQSTSVGSYAIIVVVNNTEYNGTEEKLEDYDVDKSIGTVIKKVHASHFPRNNQSNYFEEGSVIYSVKDETDLIIVEDNDGELRLLQKAPGSNSK
jgi:hypothetical protein